MGIGWTAVLGSRTCTLHYSSTLLSYSTSKKKTTHFFFLDMREYIENNAILLFAITICSSTCGERTNNKNFNKFDEQAQLPEENSLAD